MTTLIKFQKNRITYNIDELSRIGYTVDGFVYKPSDTWILTGAVEYRFGRVAKVYTVADILANKVPWFYKNRKPRCFIMDKDHGTNRVQMSPGLVSVWLKDVGYVANKYSTAPDGR